MVRDEEHSVGTGDPVDDTLDEAGEIVGHTGGPELLVRSGDKMAVVEDLESFCMGDVIHSGSYQAVQ